jgi:hypothetical protein
VLLGVVLLGTVLLGGVPPGPPPRECRGGAPVFGAIAPPGGAESAHGDPIQIANDASSR